MECANLHATDGENDIEGELLAARKLQALDHRHGEKNYNEICSDVYRGVGEPHDDLVNT